MKKTSLLLTLIFALNAGLIFAQEKVKLIDIEPEETEYGTYEANKELFPDLESGPGKVNNGVFYGGNSFWSEERKIVKTVPEGLNVNSENYRSTSPEVFVVAGEKKAGVGLWAKFWASYHQLDYVIPAGAKKFSAIVMQTDDPFGYYIHSDAQMINYKFQVLIDGKEVHLSKKEGMIGARGNGEVIDEIDIPIPAGAKKITFRLENNDGIDWNRNVELVLVDAVFEK